MNLKLLREIPAAIAEPRNPYVYTRWQYLRGITQTILAIVRCALTDHVLVDDSSIGPDSGDMSHYCTRCGWSWHHQLY